MKKCVWLSVLLAFVLWFLVFVVQPFNFWLMMSFNTLLLSGITLACGSLKKADLRPTRSDVLIGIGSALALYLIFFVGNEALSLIEKWLPGLGIHKSQNIGSIYANRGSLPPAAVAGLLFFPIGFGEEFYWRGFVQRFFHHRLGKWTALAITTALYVAVHLCTANPVLVLAALVCGVFWGGLYALTGRLPAVLLSHMIWDPLIFVLFPIY
mgnify:FL=1